MADGALDLLSRARAGDPDALGELCALYRNALRVWVRTGLGARLRAQVELADVIQETMVEVVRQFPRFNGQTEGALVGWLRCLVHEKLADLGRHYGRAKRGGRGHSLAIGEAADGDRGGLILDRLALSQTSPSQAASRREETGRLADALAGLPSRDAEVLWLYFAEGLSFRTIGSRMGMSRKSIRTICARGLKSLKRSVEEQPGGALRIGRCGASVVGAARQITGRGAPALP